MLRRASANVKWKTLILCSSELNITRTIILKSCKSWGGYVDVWGGSTSAILDRAILKPSVTEVDDFSHPQPAESDIAVVEDRDWSWAVSSVS